MTVSARCWWRTERWCAQASGSVIALKRYPVKSMMGEELNAVEVNEVGLACDRAYAIVDSSDGKVASARILKSGRICSASGPSLWILRNLAPGFRRFASPCRMVPSSQATRPTLARYCHAFSVAR